MLKVSSTETLQTFAHYTPEDILGGIFREEAPAENQRETDTTSLKRVDLNSPVLGGEALLREASNDNSTLNGILCVGERVCGIVKTLDEKGWCRVDVVDFTEGPDGMYEFEEYREAEIIGGVDLNDVRHDPFRVGAETVRGTLTITNQESEGTLWFGTDGQVWLADERGAVVVLSQEEIMDAQQATEDTGYESSRISAINSVVVEATRPLVDSVVAR